MNHICVCICTFKRPGPLLRLLESLRNQQTDRHFTYSAVVVDNDSLRSGEPVIRHFAASSGFPVEYRVEPLRSIARARNLAVSRAQGEFLAFIDDDEVAGPTWLLNLYKTCVEYKTDGVLGSVQSCFDTRPPDWLSKSGIYDRAVEPTGAVVEWHASRTGNVLIRRQILDGFDGPFRPAFRAGEDQDFFRRQIEAGRRFVWCADAAVFEVIPPARWKRAYMLRKALLRGATARIQPSCGFRSIARSTVAVPAYAAALPVALLLGQHRFMALAVRLFDHLGKLLALLSINPVREPYVSD